MYEGDFVNGKQTGKGRFVRTYSTPNKPAFVYEGDFVDNKRTGKGKETLSNGNVYAGDFVDGKWHGYGVFTWNAGPIVEGTSFLFTKKEETRRIVWDRGYVYRGTFENGVKTDGKVYDCFGILKITYTNGTAHYED